MYNIDMINLGGILVKLKTLTNDIAIDLGTDNTRIYYKGNILSEPSVIAYDSIDGSIVALGNEAQAMIGKNPETITVVKPLKNGVINDFELATQMINGFLKQVVGTVIKPRVMITIPCGITDVERRAVCDAVKASDIREVYLIETPIAGAIGAQCDVSLARGMMLIDIGGGTCDIAAISLGQTVNGKSLKVAGNDFTDKIIEFMLEKHGMKIGYRTAEKIKKEIGCVVSRDKDETFLVSGYNIKTRKPDSMLVHSEELKDIFSDICERIVAEIKTTLDETPTELLGDILEDGILLIGGGAQIYGMAKKLRIDLGMKVFLAEEADLCAARGAGSIVDNLDKMDEDSYVFTKI